MDIKIANTNNALKGIKGKVFSVDLSDCIIDQGTSNVDINKEKFTEALYTTINKMYDAEMLGNDLSSKATEIEVKYKKILASKDAAIIKYPNIDQLIGELKELKKTAEGLKKSSGTTEYDAFIEWLNKDISDYLKQSNEYKKLYIADRIDEVYRNNKTKLWEITEARKNFLTTEKNELEKAQLQLSIFQKNGVYTWDEGQHKTLNATITKNLKNNLIERPYVEKALADDMKISAFEKRANTPMNLINTKTLQKEIADFKKEFTKAEHKSAYTNYAYTIKGHSIGQRRYDQNLKRINSLL